MNKRKLAIFDIDGTIFRSSLIRELLYELISEGVFPKVVGRKVEKEYLAWANREGEYGDYIWKVVSLYKEYIKDKKESDVKIVVERTIQLEKNKLYTYTREMIKDLRSKNYFLLAISASPSFIVSEFTKQLKFDHFFGTEYEVINGVFTGIETSEGLFDKSNQITDFLSRHKDIDLSGSIGVGDTQSDIPILEFVENPIAFNPNIELAKYAANKKWKIVVERKNVVYDIEDFKILHV